MVLHFGGNILTRISQLFDKYMDVLIKGLPGPSDDESLVELKEPILFRAETDSEQLALLGIAFTIVDELLPNAVVKVWNPKNESDEQSEAILPNGSTPELKEWKRHLQHSFDKLRDHFCRQYVLSFIYSREGKTRLNAKIYLTGDGEDYWDSDHLPSLPFQVIFLSLLYWNSDNLSSLPFLVVFVSLNLKFSSYWLWILYLGVVNVSSHLLHAFDLF